MDQRRVPIASSAQSLVEPISTDGAHRYLATDFPDGTPDKWAVNQVGEDWQVSLPNGRSVKIKPQGVLDVRWYGDFASDSLTTRLWVNSLRYLINLVQSDPSEIARAFAVLENYIEYVDSFNGDYTKLRTGSLDHQIALQLRTICFLKAYCLAKEITAYDSLLSKACASLREISTELALLKPNNHGIMLCIGLLHSIFVFGEDDEGLRVDQLLRFLLDTFQASITEDGVVNENTPLYQRYWGDLLQQVEQIGLLVAKANDELQRLLLLKQKIYTAFSMMLLPNGQVPPIGDSIGGGQSIIESSNSGIISEINGIAILKNQDSFFSFICGHRGVIHKQLDDTAISYWTQGYWLILDAGLHSYDQSDQVSKNIRGSRGHSGIFSEEIDELSATSIIRYSDSTRIINGRLTAHNVDENISREISGEYSYNGLRYKRTIRADENLESITIEDSIPTATSVTTFVRFLVPPSAIVDEVSSSKGENLIEVSHSVLGPFLRISLDCVRSSGEPASASYRIRKAHGYVAGALRDDLVSLEIFPEVRLNDDAIVLTSRIIGNANRCEGATASGSLEGN